MDFVGSFCESRRGSDGDAPWNPRGIALGIFLIVGFSTVMVGIAAASVVNDFAWGDHTHDPNFNKR